MGFTTTPTLGLIKPDGQEQIKNNWVDQYEANMDAVDALAEGIPILTPGWTAIGQVHTPALTGADIGPIEIADATAYSMLRLFCKYDSSAADLLVSLRLNGVSTSDYRSGRHKYNATSALVDTAFSAALSRFVIGQSSTVSTSFIICTIFNTHVVGLKSFQSTSIRNSDSNSTHRMEFGWGSTLVNFNPVEELSVHFTEGGGAEFTAFRYWLEGFRV